jgi:hypothetical protein
MAKVANSKRSSKKPCKGLDCPGNYTEGVIKKGGVVPLPSLLSFGTITTKRYIKEWHQLRCYMPSNTLFSLGVPHYA